jgi:hypothetical protein
MMNIRRKRAIALLFLMHGLEREYERNRPLILGLKPNGWRWE